MALCHTASYTALEQTTDRTTFHRRAPHQTALQDIAMNLTVLVIWATTLLACTRKYWAVLGDTRYHKATTLVTYQQSVLGNTRNFKAVLVCGIGRCGE